MKLPKVLIFTVTYEGKDYVFDEWLEYTTKINYPNKKHIVIDNSKDGGQYYEKLKQRLEPLGIEVYKTARGNNSREALARSQNFARKYMLNDPEYEYAFSLESDILVPPNIIQELLVYRKPILGATYFIGEAEKVRVPCITVLHKKEDGVLGTRLLQFNEFNDYIHKGIKKIASCGLGATLIKRELLERFNFYYHPNLKGHSDIFFYNDLYNAGIEAFVNTDIVVKHKNIPWSKVQDR